MSRVTDSHRAIVADRGRDTPPICTGRRTNEPPEDRAGRMYQRRTWRWVRGVSPGAIHSGLASPVGRDPWRLASALSAARAELVSLTRQAWHRSVQPPRVAEPRIVTLRCPDPRVSRSSELRCSRMVSPELGDQPCRVADRSALHRVVSLCRGCLQLLDSAADTVGRGPAAR